MSTFEPGQSLGRYKILRPLGKGAMGVVYLAEDPRIERQLAIKTVRLEGREGDVEERKQRLLREAKAAGKLVHPHVVTLFDAGEEGDTLFLAFEYVKGHDLSGRLEAGPPFTLSEALRAVRQAAEGLGFAHAQGIVHRDIKPSNLLLDDRGAVKISDFGIAKMAGQATELTMTGSVVGSPHYLSPEQIRGEDLDGRSDLFSLGVVLYELLSRKRPFEAETLTSLIYQILHQEPPSLDPGAGDATAKLNAVVRKMMAKDKNERYQTAAEVAADLGAVEKALTSAQLSIPAATFLGPIPGMPTRSPAGPALAAGTAPLTSGMPVPPGPMVPPPPTAATVIRATPPPPPPMPQTQAKKALPVGILLAVVAVVVLAGVGVAVKLMLGGSRSEPTTEVAQKQEVGEKEPGVRVMPTSPGEVVSDPTDEPVPPTRLESAPGQVEQKPTPGSPPRPAETTVSPTVKPPVQEPNPLQPTPSQPTQPRPTQPRPLEPAPVETPSDESEAAPDEDEVEVSEPVSTRPAASKGRVIDTGMKLLFQGKDRQLEGWYVVIDGRSIGAALEWKERGGYELPEPGEHRVVLRKDGREQSMVINARRDLPPTAIGAALIAATSPGEGGGGGRVVRVRESIGLKVVPPSARVLVNGSDRGSAAELSGGIGKWLKLEPGRHTVTLQAPGHKSIDIAVEVSAGAPQDKLRLPQFNLVKDGR